MYPSNVLSLHLPLKLTSLLFIFKKILTSYHLKYFLGLLRTTSTKALVLVLPSTYLYLPFPAWLLQMLVPIYQTTQHHIPKDYNLPTFQFGSRWKIVAGPCEHDNEPMGSKKCRKFLEELSNYQLHNKNSSPHT
jgi:hypothetical protein